jgi:hypothetical protein
MKETFLKMIAEAEKQNISFAELCRKFLQSNGKYQSIIKEYIIISGKVPDVGPVAQATQAGFLILTQIEPYNLQEFLDLEPGFIPTKFRRYPFYNMANSSPATFLCALFLAGENQDKFSTFSLREEYEKRKRQAKEALDNLGKWAKKTVDNAGDVLRDVAGKVADVGKKVALAPFRGPFLVLVRFNVFNLARRFDRAIISDRQKTKNFWENEIGGDFAQLVKAVNLGKKESPILPGKSQTYDTSGGVSFIDPASITASIAAATPITVAATSFLAAVGVAIKEGKEVFTDLTGKPVDDKEAQETLKKVEQTTETIDKLVADAKNISISGPQAPAKDNTMLYIIGGAAILLAVILGRK